MGERAGELLSAHDVGGSSEEAVGRRFTAHSCTSLAVRRREADSRETHTPAITQTNTEVANTSLLIVTIGVFLPINNQSYIMKDDRFGLYMLADRHVTCQ